MAMVPITAGTDPPTVVIDLTNQRSRQSLENLTQPRRAASLDPKINIEKNGR